MSDVKAIFSFSKTKGKGSLNATPQERQRVKDLIDWQKRSAKTNWTLGKPVGWMPK